jgi:serine O-acetyltransferase
MAEDFIQRTLALMFPHFAKAPSDLDGALEAEAAYLAHLLRTLERALGAADGRGESVVEPLLASLPQVHALLVTDAQAIFEGDPAARSIDEVILTYPGFLAIAHYRVAHVLHEHRLPLLPRLVTELAHARTGIDIHPGATIGSRFCIDHGTGVVVGETTEIGADVKLYQGVTLGATTVEKALADKKRHPTIEDRVIIYSNATILGGHTRVGHDTVVGGNSFLTSSVPPWSVVTRTSEVRLRRGSEAGGEIDFVI